MVKLEDLTSWMCDNNYCRCGKSINMVCESSKSFNIVRIYRRLWRFLKFIRRYLVRILRALCK